MKHYTLKLKTASTTNYNLYDGTTLVSDSDLATLFATAGEAYFQFDFDSKTPSNRTSLKILDSQDAAIITNTGLTGIVEDKNFKGIWSASATAFSSFVLLTGKTLDESELSSLVGMVKTAQAGGIKTLTTADYNYPTDNPAYIAMWLLPPGIYKISSQEVVTLRFATQSRYEISVGLNLQPVFIVSESNEGSRVKFIQGFLQNKPIFYAVDTTNGSMWGNAESYGNPSIGIGNGIVLLSTMVANNLTTSNSYEKVLDARQGKVLNDKIGGDLSNLTTTDKTSLIAAINELVTRVAALEGN